MYFTNDKWLCLQTYVGKYNKKIWLMLSQYITERFVVALQQGTNIVRHSLTIVCIPRNALIVIDH